MTQPEVTPESPSTTPRRLWFLRIAGIGLILTALLLLFYGGIALTAYQSGENLRLSRQQSEQLAELAQQLTLAQSDIQNGNYELALRRLDWVQNLTTNPEQLNQIADLRRQADQGISNRLTPSPTVPPTPTPLVTPTPDPAIVYDTELAEAEFAEVALLVENGQWATALEEVIQFQTNYPSHRRGETDQMLFDAYVGLGRRYLMSDQIERGVFLLSQAERLGSLPEEVRGEMSFAKLYLEGIVFYNVNWEAFFYYFRELCTYTPLYQNSCGLLVEGLTKHADNFTFRGEWCPAQSFYSEAIRWQGNQGGGLGEKLNTAVTNCALATPTPSAITGTEFFTNTEPIETVPEQP
jgi:hypothetical protein